MTRHSPDEPLRPVWGAWGLICLGLGLVLTYVGTASNVLPGGSWALLLIGTIVLSAAFAIVSLRVGERRRLAILTLILAVGTPLFVAVGFILFFTFSYRG